ncbi:MAG TPA: biopolymer transporter ExbD, partial [Vicinamibacterales bacterium]|nr:biopolymer transporter ExbD [Vicinamibacterales bacterium]
MPKVQPIETNGGSGRGRSRRVASSLSEINVVPLVDVMLVLLIIFMVTAPMMQRGLDVNLP